MAGALPLEIDPLSFGPLGQASSACLALSVMQTAGAETATPDAGGDDSADDEAELDESAARARDAAPSRTPTTTAFATRRRHQRFAGPWSKPEKERARFILT